MKFIAKALRVILIALTLFLSLTAFLMFFEFVEALVIGSPVGAARVMQISYFGLGTLIVVAAMGMWFLELISAPDKA